MVGKGDKGGVDPGPYPVSLNRGVDPWIFFFKLGGLFGKVDKLLFLCYAREV